MTCVIFTCISQSHASMFASVAKKLPVDLSWKLLNLDNYYGLDCAQLLKTYNIPAILLHRKLFKDIPLNRVRHWQRLLIVLEARKRYIKMLDDLQPLVVVIGTDVNPLDQMLIKLCRHRKTPVLLVQDGLISPQERTDSGPAPKNYGDLLKRVVRWTGRKALDLVGLMGMPVNYGLGGADYIAVSGVHTRKVLIERGVPPARLIITGQPRFNSLHSRSDREKQDTPGDLPLDPSRQVILYASNLMGCTRYGTWDDDRLILRELIGATSRFKKTHQLVIKAHPVVDDISIYREILSELGADDILVVQKGDIVKLLNVAAVVITYGSTVALEACMQKRPLVLFDPLNNGDWISLADEGAALSAHNAGELAACLDNLINHREFREQMLNTALRVVENYTGPLDGKALARVATLIKNICNGLKGQLGISIEADKGTRN